MNTFNWNSISMNINIQEVRCNPHMKWNKYNLSCNKSITVRDVYTLTLSNATGCWNWHLLSMNINIQEVRDNPHMPWTKNGISHNIGITSQDILYLELPNATGSWD